jgi:VWFA-related protein
MLLGLLLLVPAAFVTMQDAPALQIQITGVNPTAFPTVVVNANVFDRVGQPIVNLSEGNFAVVGELIDRMRVVKVENITDDSLSLAAVLAIDTSSSMAETPLQRAKEAAISFVNSIGPNDLVAIVTFDSNESLIQDFTTDKDLLIAKISALAYGGRTALYDGALLAVQTAANSPIPRHAVIILSDGAEFGGRSVSERSAALNEALRVGVPVYTIGEGFGFDRTFMQELARGTNGQFHESPTPDELLDIYNGLARTLRSQYIITLESDLPADGTVYPLTLQVNGADGQTAQASTELRAPIPVPIPSIVGLPAEPLLEPVTVVGDALSDDGLATGQFQIDDGEPVTFEQSPYLFTIDPATLSLGEHTLSFTATDSSGDVAGVSQSFNVAPKPPVITIEGVGPIVSEPTTATITATALRGQIQSLIVRLNDQPLVSALNTASTTVTIDPAALPPGTYTLTAIASDTDRTRAETSLTFEVAALPPTVTIGGLENGQTVSEATEVSIDGTSAQATINSLIVRLNGQPLASLVNAVSTTVTIDPSALPPGDNILTAIARDTNNGRAETSVTFTVPAFPPRSITFSGLTAGETLTENRAVTVEVDSPQTAVTAVVYTLDGTEILTQTEAPFTFDLDVAALRAGSHILSVTATNAGGQSATADTAFLVAEPPTAEPTAVGPTATRTSASPAASNTPVPPTSTNTRVPTNTQVPPTVININVPPTDTTVPVTATNTDVPPTDEPTVVAVQPTNTDAPPTSTNTSVPPTATRTTIPPTDTVAPTDTTEAAVEVTTEATAEATEAVAPAATNTTEADSTAEATAESTAVGTAAPTFTPIPLTAESQGTAGQAQSPLLIGAICLLGLLLLGVIYWFAGRRRNAERR